MQADLSLPVRSNDLGVESGVAFARELASNECLVSLDLGTDISALYPNRFNNLVGVAFGQSLSQNSTLTRLGLSGVGIGKLADKGADPHSLTAAAFGGMFRANNTLEVLSVSNNMLGTAGCVLLLEGLMRNTRLRVLDLSKNGAVKTSLARLNAPTRREAHSACLRPHKNCPQPRQGCASWLISACLVGSRGGRGDGAGAGEQGKRD